MKVNPLKDNRLTVPSLARAAVMVSLVSLTLCGIVPTSVQAGGTSPLGILGNPGGEDPSDLPAKSGPCSLREPLASQTDPCPFLEQAHGFVPRLTRSATAYLQKVAEGFDPERSLRVQQALLREDLVWQSRGFSRRQIDLMVFISVALSLEEADGRLSELRQSFLDSGDPKDQRRMERIDVYRSQAVALLEQLSTPLRNVRENELRFYF